MIHSLNHSDAVIPISIYSDPINNVEDIEVCQEMILLFDGVGERGYGLDGHWRHMREQGSLLTSLESEKRVKVSTVVELTKQVSVSELLTTGERLSHWHMLFSEIRLTVANSIIPPTVIKRSSPNAT